jgi:hypothetical protein
VHKSECRHLHCYSFVSVLSCKRHWVDRVRPPLPGPLPIPNGGEGEEGWAGRAKSLVMVSKREMPASDAGARRAQVMVVFGFVSGGIALLGSTPGYSSFTPPGLIEV